MSAQGRGGRSVGHLADLPPVEGEAIKCLRLWCDSEADRGRADFMRQRGGKQAFEAMGNLCHLCLSHGRRPLMRHSVACPCVGADEACVAQMIASALQGEQDDAMMMACLLVRADMASTAVHLAESTGVALARMTGTVARFGRARSQRPSALQRLKDTELFARRLH